MDPESETTPYIIEHSWRRLNFKSVSALKSLVADFLMTREQDEIVSAEFDITKSPIVLEIYETFPLLLCHDGFFFINVGFEE